MTIASTILDRIGNCLNVVQANELRFFKRQNLPAGSASHREFSEVSEGAGLAGNKVPGCINVGYVGGLGWAQCMETVIDAAQLIQKEDLGSKIRFFILGKGEQKSELVRRSRKMGLKNIEFIPLSEKSEKLYWPIFDIFLVHYRNFPAFYDAFPDVIFQCARVGIPILLGMSGISEKFIEDEKIGIRFEPENPQDLAFKLISLQQDPSLLMELKQRCRARASQAENRPLFQNCAQEAVQLGKF